MSDLEIEKASMGLHSWIELCVAFEKRHLNDPGAILSPPSTWIINDLLAIEVSYETIDYFIMPDGRRYLVGSWPDGFSVLDLGSTSSADCKLSASDGLEGVSSSGIVQATTADMGLIKISSSV